MKRGPIEDVDLWPVWDQIRCPVLVLRGAQSDLLLAQTAEEMTRRGPRAEVVEIDGTGHAPALMAKDQIEIVRDWLMRLRAVATDVATAPPPERRRSGCRRSRRA